MSKDLIKDWDLDRWLQELANPKQFTLAIDEGQRQMVLMALAHLAAERPGWDYPLGLIAEQIDERLPDGTLQLYTEFKKLHAPTHLLTLQLDAIGAVLVQPPKS